MRVYVDPVSCSLVFTRVGTVWKSFDGLQVEQAGGATCRHAHVGAALAAALRARALKHTPAMFDVG